jgi:hypothetical protein
VRDGMISGGVCPESVLVRSPRRGLRPRRVRRATFGASPARLRYAGRMLGAGPRDLGTGRGRTHVEVTRGSTIPGASRSRKADCWSPSGPGACASCAGC